MTTSRWFHPSGTISRCSTGPLVVERRVIARAAGPAMLALDMPKRNGAGIELLADPTRRRIIAALALRPRRPSSLAAELGSSRPAISRQLRLLCDAGLVRTDRSLLDGRVVLYRIEPRNHGPITAWLAGTGVAHPVALRLDKAGVVRDG